MIAFLGSGLEVAEESAAKASVGAGGGGMAGVVPSLLAAAGRALRSVVAGATSGSQYFVEKGSISE